MSYKDMGYKLIETSIQFNTSVVGVRVDKLTINTSFYDGRLNFSEKDCKEMLDSITPREECEKIWNTFDYQAVQNACKKIKADKDIHIIIENFQQFEQALKDLGIYETYLKEKTSLDEKRKLLKSDSLIGVKFRNYESWETGLCFLILNERVEKNIFDKLKKSGLYYHKIDEENEEKFTGWCISDNEMNRLKLAENDIKVRDIEELENDK